jgi:hypothetical protein
MCNDIFITYVTSTVPVIHGCTVHTYGYVPGSSNVTLNEVISGAPGGTCP